MLSVRTQIKSISSTKKDKRTKTNIRHQDQETKLLNKPISPRRLREGGAAMLQALNTNHHIAICIYIYIYIYIYTACESPIAIYWHCAKT
jgi:hypothetical protein